MKIGTTEIGPGHDPYVIAEIGVNHDGEPARAMSLIRLAASAGADAVKFQLFEADRLMSRASKLAAYQKAAGETDPLAMLRRLELSLSDLRDCVAEAHRLGIHAIVSVFSLELVGPARELAWDAFKSASPDIINQPLLVAMADTGKPLIVSTGASTPDEISQAASWLKGARDRVAFLQCVSAYPTPLEAAAIEGIAGVRAASGEPVGYSDHTAGEATGAVAVAHGASILEKHFTDSRQRTGPDHRASLEPAGFARYVALAKAAQAVDPRPGVKVVLPIEEDVRRVSRQSLVTTRALGPGHVLSRADLTIKRPGTGLAPFELDRVIGATTARAIDSDMPLCYEDLAR